MSSDTKSDKNSDDNTDSTKSTESTEIQKPPKAKYIFSYGRALEPKYSNPSIAGYYRPWRFTDKRYSGVSKVFYAHTREFRVALDVSQFPYESIFVKVIDKFVVVEGRHDKIADSLGKIRRQFTRKYKTPPDVKLASVHGKYKKGILYIWGDRVFEQVEKSDIAQVEQKSHSIVTKENAVQEKSPQLARNDVERHIFDGRLDKRDARFKQKTNENQNQQIIQIDYSPESP